MQIDTVLKFVGQEDDSGDTESLCSLKTLETMAQMGRFLAPTHQILIDLKLRFISQIETQVRIISTDPMIYFTQKNRQ